MSNPFALYSPEDRALAIEYNIVASVARSLGMPKSKISRTFSGIAVRPDKRVVRSLNRWLKDRNLPVALVSYEKPDLGKLRKVA